MNKLFFIVFVVTSFALQTSCCKKSTVVVPNSDHDALCGTWLWVQSSGGIAGQTTTPLTEGRNSSIEFNQKGSCTIIIGNEKDIFEYTLSEGNSIYSENSTRLIKYEEIKGSAKKNAPMNQSFQFRGTDTLLLNDECYDCFAHVYVREKSK